MEELLNSLNKVNTTLEESLRITNENVAYIAAETTSMKQKLASMSVETRNALDKLVKSATHALTIGKEKLSRSDTMLNVLKTIKTNSDMNAKVGNGNTKVLNKILSNSSNLQDNIRTTLSYPLKALNSRIGVLAGSINGAFKTFKSSIANTTGAVISTVKSSFGKFGKTLSSLATIHGAIGLLGHAMLSSIKIGANLILTPLKLGFSALTNFFKNSIVGKLVTFGLLAFSLYRFITGTKLGTKLYTAFKNSEIGKSIINGVTTLGAIAVGVEVLPTMLTTLSNYIMWRKFNSFTGGDGLGGRGLRRRAGRRSGRGISRSAGRSIGRGISRGAGNIGRGLASAGRWLGGGGNLAKFARGGIIGATVGVVGNLAMNKAAEKGMINNNTHNVGSKALSGAALGATIGSIIPGVGTAVGAAIGGIGGAAVGFIQNQIDKKNTELSKLDKMHNTAQVANNATVSTVHNANTARRSEQVQVAKVSSRDSINTKLTLSTKEYEKAQHADAVKQQAELEKANKLNKEMVNTMKDLSLQLARDNTNFNHNRAATINPIAI
jgi:hypothetical protein